MVFDTTVQWRLGPRNCGGRATPRTQSGADAWIALLIVNPNYPNYPNDEATWGVLGTARSDATGQFRLPYASPGSYVLAVDAPATSVYGGVRLPNLSVSTGIETQTGTLIVPHK